MVSKVMNKSTAKFNVLYIIRMHNVFHVPLLNRCSPHTTHQTPSEPQPTVVDDSEEWEVDPIFDSN
jgi:hypothetical protein